MANAGPIPPLGLGTFLRTGDEGTRAILKGIEIGYRHIDSAQNYETEQQVGEAIRRSGIPRDQFFVTTKVGDARLDKASFMPSVEKSLKNLNIGPIDLLLIHWPSEKDRVPFEEYMTELAEARRLGHARLIGVSNYNIALLKKAEAMLGPGALATNQVELHPFLQQPKLRHFCRSIGLPITCYTPLAKGDVARDPTIMAIAERHRVGASAIGLAFLMAEGHIAIPASGSEANMRANFAALTVKLTEADIVAMRALDRGHRIIDPEKAPEWDD